jgi:hypothetical protein
MKNRRSIFIIIVSFILIIFYSSCNDDKINGKYTILADGGMKRLIGGNVVSDRKDVYPDIIDIKYDKNFVLLKQVPDRGKYAMYLSSNLYNLYCAYSNYLKDSVVNKKWEGLQSDSVVYAIFKSRGASIENTSKDIQIRLNVADSLLNHAPNYQKIFANDTNYWIIDEVKDTLIGPLIKSEYLIQMTNLKIPDDLKLD